MGSPEDSFDALRQFGTEALSFQALATAWALFRAARRPKRRALAVLALAAGVDAIMSVRHLAITGWGHDAITVVLRGLATLGPLIGAAALVRAATLLRPDARR